MSQLRIEVYSLVTLRTQAIQTSHKGDTPNEVYTLSLTTSPTATGNQPLIDASTPQIVTLIADTDPVYVAIGVGPDPTNGNGILVLPRTPVDVAVTSLASISAVLATDFNLIGNANAVNVQSSALPSGAATDASSQQIVTSLAGTVKTQPQANAQRVTATGALAALNAVATLAIDGMNSAVVQLLGTWVGTVSWFGSADGGTTYYPMNMIPYGGGTSAGSATANGLWEMACGGLTHLQAKMTAFTSGSAAALIAASNGVKSVRVGNPSANPLTVNQAGSTGLDYSGATAAAVPIAGFVLLATIPVTPTRSFIEAQNQSIGTIQVVRDDGLGNNQTSILLASGGAANSPGQSWSSPTFKGRLRVYGAAGAQIATYQD